MMMNSEPVLIKCIEVEQPIGTFYVGKIKWKDLLDISYNDIRRIQKEEKCDIESFFGIQRDLAPKRLKEISEYVSFSDATFPSSIVLAISSIDELTDAKNIISYNKEIGELKLLRNEKIAHIIDGQHRVFGLKQYSEKNKLFDDELKFELIVTLFIDIDLDDQSMIFATINKAQTKVNNSLVYDLYDLAKSRSPYRTSHNVVRLLNETKGSPFKDKVKMLGKADDSERETITQATLVENIVKYISKDPLKDRDLLKRGQKLDLLEKEKTKLFFREWFIQQEDEKIAKIIWNYFSAVKRKWPNAWNQNSILVKSTGIISLMKFLPNTINKLGISKTISEDDFFTFFEKININEVDFNTQKYIPGVNGQSDLYKDLLKGSGLNICKKDHRYDLLFKDLPDSQEFHIEDERHQCAGCSYDQGYNDAINGKENGIRLGELNKSQAGVVRHKDPIEAYNMGYKAGLKEKEKK